MGSPAFNPNASYSVPAFDPSAAFTAAQDKAPDSAPATDTRNWLQKQVDKLTTVTPEDEERARNLSAVHPQIGEIANQAQKFGAGAIQGLTQPFVHPLDTLSGIGQTIMHPVNTGKQMLQSAASNPAQTAGNVVGGALLGEAAGPAVAPVAKAAGKVAGRAVLLGKTPEAAYESALKPSTTLSEAQRTNIVQTGIQNEIPISKAGLEKIGDRIDTLNQAIKDEIARDPNRPISTVPAINNLQSVRAKFANQVTPQPDMAEISAVQRNFMDNPKVQPQGAGPGPGSLPAAEAQAMKQGTYQALGSKAYGEVKGASIEAQKALARGLKEEIATQFPELSNLNAAESKLLDLQPVLERAVNRISNHQLIGIGTPVAGAAAKAVTGSSGAGAAVGVLKAVLDNPAVKSRLAIAVSKAQKIPFAQATMKVQAYSSALGASVGATQGYSSDASPNQ